MKSGNRKSNGAAGLTDRDIYVLDKAPVILAGLMFRRQSTSANELAELAITSAQHIYDVVHEVDVPAEAMTSRPIAAAD